MCSDCPYKSCIGCMNPRCQCTCGRWDKEIEN